MPKTKRLTAKEAELVRLKAKGEPHHKAYRKAYSKTAALSTANSNTQKILKKPHVRDALEAALERNNITIDSTLAPVSRALQAKDTEGNDDIETQLKGYDRAAKLLGIAGNDTQQGNFHLHLHEAKNKYKL